MMPFDSTTVIPAAWSQHHQAAAAGGMNATVTIGRPEGEPHYDPETDDTTVGWSQEYSEGPARIQEMSQAQQETDAAGQAITGRAYLVQLDARHAGADDVRKGMRVRTTASTNDALLLDRYLWVVDIPVGSERFTRDLICSDSQGDAPAPVTP